LFCKENTEKPAYNGTARDRHFFFTIAGIFRLLKIFEILIFETVKVFR